MSGYDAWLEAPFQKREEENERFCSWCEEYGVDPESDNAEEDFQQWLRDAEDDYYSEQAEAMAEDAYFDRFE